MAKSYRSVTLPVRASLRSVVLCTLHGTQAEVFELPLALGETEPRTVEVRNDDAWGNDVDRATLTPFPGVLPAGWVRLTPPPS